MTTPNATPSQPGEFICLDATPLLAFAKIGEVDLLQAWLPDACVSEYVIFREVLDWCKDYPENKIYLNRGWPRQIAADETADTEMILKLRPFFPAGRNEGELHTIALTHRFRGTAILDDGTAAKVARGEAPGMTSVFDVSLVCAAAVSGLISDNEALALHQRLEAIRPEYHAILRKGDTTEFRQLLYFYRGWKNAKGWGPWPYCLHNEILDSAAVKARNGNLDILRATHGIG